MELSIMFFASLAGGGARSQLGLLFDAARRADREGFSAVWTPERHFDAFGGIFPNPALTAAALAPVTERIGLRAGSVISPLHDPLRLAEDWAVVDNLSGGRVGVSFGSGWNPDDFVLNASAYPHRRDVMWEQIEVIRHLWRGGVVKRPNGRGEVVEVGLRPPPVRAELPLWVTTGGTPSTFIRAGAAGARVLTHALTQDLEGLAARIGDYRAGRAGAGLDPAGGHVTVMLHAYVGRDEADARRVATGPLRAYLRSALELDLRADRAVGVGAGADDVLDDDLVDELVAGRAERYFTGPALLGDPARCAAVMDAAGHAGIDEIACLLDFGIDPTTVLAGLDRLAELRRRLARTAAH